VDPALVLRNAVKGMNAKLGLSLLSEPPLPSQVWEVRCVRDTRYLIRPKGVMAVLDVPCTRGVYST
jgi:hypothetical protein